MKTRTTVICSLFASCSALAGGGLVLYFRSLAGTAGLLEWMPAYRTAFLAVSLVALAPLPPLAFAICLSNRGRRIPSAIVLILAMLLSLAMTTGSIAGIAYHHSLARKAPERLAGVGEYRAGVGRPLVRLAFSSDPHIGSPNADTAARDATLRTVATGGYDALFVLGDLSEMGVPGTGLEDAAALLRTGLGTAGTADASGPDARPATPLVTLMGNHDAIVGGEWRYRNIFNEDLYYRIDSGTTHVIALNLLWGAESFDAAQKTWLLKTLDSIPASDETIVIAHSFIRSSGYVDATTGKSWYDNPDLIRDLAPILESNGVDLVVSGHNHFMEYLEHGGTAYAIVGALGGKSDPERTYISPDSRWYLADGKGFLDVDLYGDGMRLTFRDQTGKQLFSTMVD